MVLRSVSKQTRSDSNRKGIQIVLTSALRAEHANGPRAVSAKLRTLPDQIAEQLGMAIVEGVYVGGERILEQKLSEDYGVSRGPVRDALRVLEERGLVQIFPRRGAYAVRVSLDLIADLFNVRASLLGLSARYLARSRDAAGLADLAAKAAALRAMADNPAIDPTSFALANGRLGAVLYRHSGSDYLARFLREQGDKSIWGLIWRQRPLDFLTLERRHESTRLWTAVSDTVSTGDEHEAERLVQEVMFASRDSALRVLAELRNESVAPAKILRARPGSD